MKWDSSKPWIFTVVRNGFQVLNSKQIVTMADYTFNYSLLFINHRLINLSVDCPWDLSPQGWFPVPILAAAEELFSSCLLTRGQEQVCLGEALACSCCHLKRQHVRPRSVASVSPEPTSPPRLPRPGAAQGLSFLVLHTVTLLPHVALSFLFHKLLPTQNIGRQLE